MLNKKLIITLISFFIVLYSQNEFCKISLFVYYLRVNAWVVLQKY